MIWLQLCSLILHESKSVGLRLLSGILLLCAFAGLNAYGQKTMIYTDPEADLKTGIELFQKEKYGQAQQHFKKIIRNSTNPYSISRIDAEFYDAICATELFHKDGELLLRSFVAGHPESPRVKMAYFYLGKYNFRKKDYKDVLDWFSKVDVYDLSKDERFEYLFKRGYSNFALDSIQKAKPDLYEVKDIDNKYAAPAKYYFSHIAYTEKNYETALQGFKSLVDNEDFGPIVPYYIVQILFLQGNYNEAIEIGTPLLDSANTRRAPEIARVIGESYYKTERYKESIPYFKRYERRVVNLNSEDSYELGYAYYQINDINSAIVYLQGATATKEENLISQNAYYHLADCYIKKNEKKSARSAYYAASKLDFDKNIQEDALFSYAKLCYELAFDPYNETIQSFKEYLRLFPDSRRKDEAYAFLINTYLTTKNYPEAIHSIEQIDVVNEELKKAYQKIAYLRAVEFYNSYQLDSALKYFDKALVYQTDKELNALAHYWKGEVFYKKNNYSLSIHNYKEFMAAPGAFELPEYNISNYNIGYAYFKQNDYESANISFRKFTDFRDKKEKKKMSDAYNRTGDTYFMMKRYADAVESYDKSISLSLVDEDYAMYQKALALGVLKKDEKKVETLNSLIDKHKTSAYLPAARYELARTYMLTDKQDQALKNYEAVVSNYPTSTYYSKSLLKIGLIYYNQSKDDKAFFYLDKVVKNDSRSIDAQEALKVIKNIYIAKDDVEGMENYFASISYDISNTSLDSIAFEIGKKYYLKGQCEEALREFEKYNNKFESGLFKTDVMYYSADCHFKDKENDKAIEGFSYVISQSKNAYTERSLVNLATIYMEQEKYEEAVAVLERIDKEAEYAINVKNARIDLMQISFMRKDYSAAKDAASNVLKLPKLQPLQVEQAKLVMARCELEMENYDNALTIYSEITKGPASNGTAEANYYVAYITYLQSDFKKAEKIVFDFIQNESANPHWMTKSLIVLADCYSAEGDDFQARKTLESVLENTDNEELKAEAKQRLTTIEEKELEKVPQLSNEELKIEFKQNKVNYQNLYNEPLLLEVTDSTKTN